MKVNVERYVEQVRDGSHYKGHVKIADTQLEYELVFTVPIPKLDDMEPPNGITEICRLLQLTMKRNGIGMELTDEEYGFFLNMLLEFVVDFCNNPQTRDNNEGFFGMTLRGEGPMAAFGASASIFPLRCCRISPISCMSNTRRPSVARFPWWSASTTSAFWNIPNTSLRSGPGNCGAPSATRSAMPPKF